MKITPGIYRSVSTVALPLASLYLMWRSRRQPAYRDYWDERFAWGTYPLRTERPRVWIHAVSVGETNAAKPLLEAMLKSWPECDVVLTHMTPTGREAGKRLVRLAPERIRQCYLPYDAPYAVEKFVRQVRPTLGVIMETEVWPNLMHEMTAHGIPVVLANARESEKSRAQAQKAIEVMGPAFGSFAAVLAQSDEDKARLESLGAKDVLVTGSVKFDIVPDASQMAAAKAWLTVLSRPVVLLASTRDGEEAAFLESFKKHPALLAETLVVVVPRHPERFERVVELFESAGLKTIRRSTLSTAEDLPADIQIVVGDSMGEMSFYCGLASMTVMGVHLVLSVRKALWSRQWLGRPSWLDRRFSILNALSAKALPLAVWSRRRMRKQQFFSWSSGSSTQRNVTQPGRQLKISRRNAPAPRLA